ncbi:cationic amino acid transporter 2 [Tetranychus urticae]|uniref:Cationic amino acid transporter C-terminal domain-containing protein n=1 Tax=Tetranychus urticae TaxID=32264 RepID=T1JXK6_TETUR|nr:cationic amino acid transporter 2 [Tetranychus urticae]XP_015794759.1 cationic amino acid transporter 2 [Tetranychus urticae]XP_025018606.1 cationic amino acid transporter 2 [Tetranychus urticae]
MSNVINKFTRRKPIQSEEDKTQLKRCLNSFDLISLGVGSSLGQAVYIIIGQIVSRKAGPSALISFGFAGLAAFLSAMCFAEFGSITPKAGSAYIYAYVTVGELVAFTIGWNLSLEYLVGTACSARGLSEYLDGFLGGAFSNIFKNYFPINIPFFSPYFDPVSFMTVLAVSVIIGFGVRESIRVIHVFNLVNLYATFFIILCGLTAIEWSNWRLPESSIPEGYGVGGFFPYGINGMLSGAGTAFWAFIGFDCIATTGDETENPKKRVPYSIFATVIIVASVLFLSSFVATLVTPYYYQDTASPWDEIFKMLGWSGFPILIITAGALTSLIGAVFGALHPLPRILYAMSSDRLVYSFFSKINSKTQTPFFSTLLAGFLAALLAALFESRDLADLGSIGTLLVYAIVAGAILVLRYVDLNETEDLLMPDDYPKRWDERLIRSYFRLKSTSHLIMFLLKSIYLMIFVLVTALFIYQQFIPESSLAGYFCLILALITVFLIVVLSNQPQKTRYGSKDYIAPLVPYLPCLSIFVNLYLMSRLTLLTWSRFTIWTLFGAIIYFTFGIKNSIGYLKKSNSSDDFEKYTRRKSYGTLEH